METTESLQVGVPIAREGVPGVVTAIEPTVWNAARDALVALWSDRIVNKYGWAPPTQAGIARLRRHAETLLQQIAAEPIEAWQWFIETSDNDLETEFLDCLDLEWIKATQRK